MADDQAVTNDKETKGGEASSTPCRHAARRTATHLMRFFQLVSSLTTLMGLGPLIFARWAADEGRPWAGLGSGLG